MMKIVFAPIATLCISEDLRGILTEFVRLWNSIGLGMRDLGAYCGPFSLRTFREQGIGERTLGPIKIAVVFHGEQIAELTEVAS